MSNIAVLDHIKPRKTDEALRKFREERQKLVSAGYNPDEMLHHLGHFITLLSLEDAMTWRLRNE